MVKACARCGVLKSYSEFYPRPEGRLHLHSRCKECERAAARLQSGRRYIPHPRFDPLPNIRSKSLRCYYRLRRSVLSSLGGRCAECGVKDPLVLEVHHVEQNGGLHRRSRGVWGYWRDVVRNPDLFRLLCANCHTRREQLKRLKHPDDFVAFMTTEVA